MKNINEQIKEVRTQLINCKDARQSENLVNELLALHKQSLHTPVELEVPCSEVRESIDLGSCKLSRTIRGYLFEAKGGMYTFVEHKMASTCAMLNTVFEYNKIQDKTEEQQQLTDSFISAVKQVMLAPIFSSMDEISLFTNAKHLLHTYQEYCEERYTNAEAPERTEEDYKEDAEFENTTKAMEIITESPLPPEDTAMVE